MNLEWKLHMEKPLRLQSILKKLRSTKLLSSTYCHVMTSNAPRHILTKLDIDTYSKLDLLHECLLCAVRCSNLEYAKYMIKQVKKENMQLFAMLAHYEQPRSRNTEVSNSI